MILNKFALQAQRNLKSMDLVIYNTPARFRHSTDIGYSYEIPSSLPQKKKCAGVRLRKIRFWKAHIRKFVGRVAQSV